jgi:hypothetical protein
VTTLAAYLERQHPRDSKGRWAHTPGGPSSPGVAAPPAGRDFPRARRDVANRLGDELAAQMPGWRQDLGRYGQRRRVDLRQAHLIQTVDPAEVDHRVKLLEAGAEISDPVGVWDEQTSRVYLIDQAESAAARARLGETHADMTVVIPKVQKVTRGPKPGGGLNRATVDTWFRWLITHEELPSRVTDALVGGRLSFRKNTPSGDREAIALIREAAKVSPGNAKLADRLEAYADKMERALAPRPGAGGPKPAGGKIDRREVLTWLVQLGGDSSGDVPPGVAGPVGTAAIRMSEGKDRQAALQMRAAAAVARDLSLDPLAKRLEEAATALDGQAKARRQDHLDLKGITPALGKEILRGRDELGRRLGTPDSRFHGRIRTGTSNSRAGTMAWDGEMWLEKGHAAQLERLARADARGEMVTKPDAVRVLLHETLHAEGEGSDDSSSADGSFYAFSSSGREIEEGFTELGARLLLPDFVERMGWADRPTNQLQSTTMREWAAAVANPQGFRSKTGWGSYQKLVKSAWAFCMRAAYDEGQSTQEGMRKRARELAIEITGKQSRSKLDAMAVVTLRAQGLDPDEIIATKIGRQKRREIIAELLQATWKRATVSEKDPAQELAAAMTEAGAT